MYAAANDILGNVVKVTPSSKVVGDLALALVAAGADPAEFEADPASYDVPDSVIGFLNGELGDPPGGWPEPFRTKALAGPHLEAADRDPHRRAAGQPGVHRPARATLNELLFPGPTAAFRESRENYGDLSARVDHRLPLRPASRRGAPRAGARGPRDALRPRGDQRARRARHPQRDGDRRRPDAAGAGARPQHLRGRRLGREGRPDRQRARRGALRRRGDGDRRRGRQRRGGPDGGDDRGDEDGGLDHRPGRRDGPAGSRCRPRRPSRVATWCW